MADARKIDLLVDGRTSSDSARPSIPTSHALAKALVAALHASVSESAVHESFAYALASVRADRGLLVHVRADDPLSLEVICAEGYGPGTLGAEASGGAVDPCVGTIRESIQARHEITGRRFASVPVMDELTHVPTAVFYVEAAGGSGLDDKDLAGLRAYAAALAHSFGMRPGGLEARDQLTPPTQGPDPRSGPEIVGASTATRALLKQLQSYLPSVGRPEPPPILILGESGTGKELVARYLHHYSPKRNRGPFQAVNCAALRGELAEARLFGHARGAFTGAIADAKGLLRIADNGLFFLDEIGELSPEGQALLLRVLENRTVQSLGGTREIPVDVQIVAATNRDLQQEVAAGRFREDLYYRINALRVILKPLRHPARFSDIRPLLSFYLASHERRLQKKTLGLTASALRQLLHYAWPGNVRQLANVCTSLVTHVAPGAWIDVADISEHHPEVIGGPRNTTPDLYLEDDAVSYADALRAFRKKLVIDRLERFATAAQAAASLGISEATFYRYWQDTRRIQ
jgi:DNA-binding NtrC family response regulator